MQTPIPSFFSKNGKEKRGVIVNLKKAAILDQAIFIKG